MQTPGVFALSVASYAAAGTTNAASTLIHWRSLAGRCRPACSPSRTCVIRAAAEAVCGSPDRAARRAATSVPVWSWRLLSGLPPGGVSGSPRTKGAV